MLIREAAELVHLAVDSQADPRVGSLGLEVDIRRARIQRLREYFIDDLDANGPDVAAHLPRGATFAQDQSKLLKSRHRVIP